MDPRQLREARVSSCIDEIVADFHTPLLRELARLGVGLREARCFFAGAKAIEAYGHLLGTWSAYRQATEAHVFKEEVEVFPRLRLRVGAPAASLYVMRLEHAAEAQHLVELVACATACDPERAAVESWAQLVVELEELSTFQRRHAHHEEGVLLPLVLGD